MPLDGKHSLYTTIKNVFLCVCAVVGSSRVYLAPVLSVFLSVLVGVSSRVLYCLDANDVVLSYLHTTWRLLVRLLRILMGFVNI